MALISFQPEAPFCCRACQLAVDSQSLSTSECLHFVCILKGHFTGYRVPGPPFLALWRLPPASRSFISGKESAVSHVILLRVMSCFSSAAVDLLFVQGAL